MRVVDSSFLIRLLRGHGDAVRKAEELDAAGGAATTVVSVFEVSYGVSRGLNDPVRRLGELRRLLGNLEVLPLSIEASLKASEICGVYVEAGRRIDPFDALVAGVAVTCGAEALVTRNVQVFDLVSSLKVEGF